MKVSNCCDAPIIEETDFCSACMEHCSIHEEDHSHIIIGKFMNEEILEDEFGYVVRAESGKLINIYEFYDDWNNLMTVVEYIIDKDSSNMHISGPGYLAGRDGWTVTLCDDQKNRGDGYDNNLQWALRAAIADYIAKSK